MISVAISVLKNRLSEYVRHVKKGETIIVMDRDQPVAELRPFAQAKNNLEGDLALLESQGLVRRGNPKKLKSWTPGFNKKNLGVLDALLLERTGGR